MAVMSNRFFSWPKLCIRSGTRCRWTAFDLDREVPEGHDRGGLLGDRRVGVQHALDHRPVDVGDGLAAVDGLGDRGGGLRVPLAPLHGRDVAIDREILRRTRVDVDEPLAADLHLGLAQVGLRQVGSINAVGPERGRHLRERHRHQVHLRGRHALRLERRRHQQRGDAVERVHRDGPAGQLLRRGDPRRGQDHDLVDIRRAGVSVRQDMEPSGPVHLCFDEPGVGPVEDVDAAVEQIRGDVRAGSDVQDLHVQAGLPEKPVTLRDVQAGRRGGGHGGDGQIRLFHRG